VTCPHAYSDGVYVLGALGPAERAAYEAHLAQCSSCAAAVAQLAVLPGLLGRVSEEALRPVAPEPGRLNRLLEKVAELRRRQARARRWRFAATLAAVAVLAVAGTAAVFTVPARDVGPALVAMTPVAPGVELTADVGYEAVAGGTKVWMVCRYPKAEWEVPSRVYRLVATGADGSQEQLGSWWAEPGEQVDMTGLTQYRMDELVGLELQTADGDPVLVLRLGR